MSSRSKAKLEEAEVLIKSFLIKYNNDAEKAWDEYIKYHLRRRLGFPANIKGIKDFKRVAKKIEIENMDYDNSLQIT